MKSDPAIVTVRSLAPAVALVGEIKLTDGGGVTLTVGAGGKGDGAV